jgi:hypothetical protein
MPDNPIAPLALKISEACAASRCGRTTVYEAIKRGDLRALKRGKSTLAPMARKPAGDQSQSLKRSARRRVQPRPPGRKILRNVDISQAG